MLKIGPVKLPNSLILAPLAGYSDLPFRKLCREFGAGLCVSEMISCHGLVYKQDKTLSMLQSCTDERPVSFQLFGADPDIMGEAASIINSFPHDFIDINMGCPVKKVTKRGAGAALMANLALAEKIVKKVVDNSKTPVTLKIRAGVDSSSINAESFAIMAEANGISAITVHGRTWKQAFTGLADWDVVKSVKNTVTIPVIGNGDITSNSEALQKLTDYCCDGVMIGRAAIGNPWIFGEKPKPHQAAEIADCSLRHIELIETYLKRCNLSAMKNHLGKYFKGIPGSSSFRKLIYETPDWTFLKSLLSEIRQQHLTSE